VRLVWWAVALRVVAIVGFAALLLDCIVTAVRWWQGELVAPTIVDWIEIGLLPVLLLVYLRYLSILRSDCRACEPPAGGPPSAHPGP
jgi:hypothetical protein